MVHAPTLRFKHMDFYASKVNEFFFHKGDVLILVYVDDCIIVSKRPEDPAEFIKQLNKAKFDITGKGNVRNYLGVRVTHLTNGKIKLAQPHLINHIVTEINLKSDSNTSPIPALSTVLLHKGLDVHWPRHH